MTLRHYSIWENISQKKAKSSQTEEQHLFLPSRLEMYHVLGTQRSFKAGATNSLKIIPTEVSRSYQSRLEN